MSSEDHKALIRRLVAEGWNQGNLATLDEIIAPNLVDHSPMVPNLSPGSEGYKQFVVATGKQFTETGIYIFRMAGGKVVDR